MKVFHSYIALILFLKPDSTVLFMITSILVSVFIYNILKIVLH